MPARQEHNGPRAREADHARHVVVALLDGGRRRGRRHRRRWRGWSAGARLGRWRRWRLERRGLGRWRPQPCPSTALNELGCPTAALSTRLFAPPQPRARVPLLSTAGARAPCVRSLPALPRLLATRRVSESTEARAMGVQARPAPSRVRRGGLPCTRLIVPRASRVRSSVGLVAPLFPPDAVLNAKWDVIQVQGPPRRNRRHMHHRPRTRATISPPAHGRCSRAEGRVAPSRAWQANAVKVIGNVKAVA